MVSPDRDALTYFTWETNRTEWETALRIGKEIPISDGDANRI